MRKTQGLVCKCGLQLKMDTSHKWLKRKKNNKRKEKKKERKGKNAKRQPPAQDMPYNISITPMQK